MIFLGILLCIAGIGFLCWLLFTLAVYALPFFVGVTTGVWAYGTGAGPIGAFIVGIAAAGATLAVGRFTFTVVRPVWARLAVALLFAAPASVGGYHATHGLATLAVPSVGWQIAFSIVGAIAVGIAAWVRLLAMAPPEPAKASLAAGRQSLRARTARIMTKPPLAVSGVTDRALKPKRFPPARHRCKQCPPCGIDRYDDLERPLTADATAVSSLGALIQVPSRIWLKSGLSAVEQCRLFEVNIGRHVLA